MPRKMPMEDYEKELRKNPMSVEKIREGTAGLPESKSPEEVMKGMANANKVRKIDSLRKFRQMSSEQKNMEVEKSLKKTGKWDNPEYENRNEKWYKPPKGTDASTNRKRVDE